MKIGLVDEVDPFNRFDMAVVCTSECGQIKTTQIG